VINRLARYRPIVGFIKRHNPASILEIGSGLLGLGEFWRGSFVGVDMEFDGAPTEQMVAVKASGTRLPFEDASFDLVLCLDVLEHVDPELREEVVGESARVARRYLILGFPTGAGAEHCDRSLVAWCLRKRVPIPRWLEEHVRFPYPDARVLQAFGGAVVLLARNENIWLHRPIIQGELHPSEWIRRCMGLLRYKMRPFCELGLRLVHFPPHYRSIFVVSKPGPWDRLQA
jgi:hypothetical protein